MSALQTYEESGGWVAITFVAVFASLVGLMGYAGACQQEALRVECEAKGGDFVKRPHSESLCVPKGQVISLTMNY